MSLDLIKEFGTQNQNPQDSLRANTVGQKPADREGFDEDDFGDFEVPDDQTSTQKQNSTLVKFNNPSVGVLGVGDLVDVTDGSTKYMGSSPLLASETDAKSSKSHSLFERRILMFERRPLVFEKRTSPFEKRTKLFERRAASANTSPPQPPGAEAISENGSVLEKLEDEDWDEFVEYPVLTTADGRNTQQDNFKENTILEQQPTKWSSSVNSSIERLGETAASSLKSADIEPTQSMRLAKNDDFGLPPSNIPPPSILLLLIETIFQSLQIDIKKILSLTEASFLPLGQSRLGQLELHISMVRAAARILAGRKLRWKRDTHLSQSMKIGPAHSGKAGGMKLTGVDRTESLREDREVAEALGIWRKQVGGIRAAITMVNTEMGQNVLVIPNISENMHVRGVKLEDGALAAPKSCFLCGLKRDERLEKIDVDVEDSFGEWWTEHWGHNDCRVFWERREGSLEQRR